MNETKETKKEVKEDLTLNEAIIKIRVALQESKLKKSGRNKFAGFEYFELADFLPTLNKLMLAEKINDHFEICNGEATLTLIKGAEREKYTIPYVAYETPLNSQGKPSMQDIQYLGALNTYYKRYLYLNAFGITDGEVIDAMDNSNLAKGKKAAPAPAPAQASAPVQSAPVEMASVMQVAYIAELPEDKLASVLKNYRVKTLSDLTYKQAEGIIEYMKKVKAEGGL